MDVKVKMALEKVRHKDIWEIFEELIIDEDDKEKSENIK